MSQITPTTETAVQLESQVNGANNSGNTDIMHFISDGTVVSWIDFQGFPGGNLDTGGGGGSTVFVNGIPVPNPNFLAGANVSLTAVGSDVTIASTGGGGGGGSNVFVNGTPVANPNFVAGTNTTVSLSGSNVAVNVSSTGVTSLNSLTGAVAISAGSGISVAEIGNDILISNTGATEAFPVIDIQTHGGVPKTSTIANESTTVTTVGGNASVTLAAAKNFVNNEGVVIYGAGAATTLSSAPTAPTVTCPSVSGSGPSGTQQTISYQIVGFDAQQGLSPASSNSGAAGQLVTAPSIFGNPQSKISSISQSGDVVTATFTTPLSSSASILPGMTLHITGFGAVAGDRIFNGIWTIATAPANNNVTFALAGSYGSGTVSAATLGRVSNTALITAISRASTGVVTVTTAQNHNFTTQTGSNPTIVDIRDCLPLDLNGQWVIATASGTTITYNTGILTAETGIVNINNDTGNAGTAITASTATVWEFINVACPAFAGVTKGYYIYSDSPSPGNGLVLIGKSVYKQTDFTDWGPFYGGGYVAPAYVPTTPPAVSQNQLFASTISSGAGTTSLTLSTPVTTTVTNATIVHDDSQALIAAANALTTGSVLLSPPTNGTANAYYILSYPQTFPGDRDIIPAAGIIANETLAFTGSNNINPTFGSVTTVNPQFSRGNYSSVIGLANPLLAGAQSFSMSGMSISCGTATANAANGRFGVVITDFYSAIENCSFFAGNSGTYIPLTYIDAGASSLIDSCAFLGYSVLGSTGVIGQSSFGPPVPIIWYRASTALGLGIAQTTMSGANTFAGRGILYDQKHRTTGSTTGYILGSALWNQAASTPMVMFWGSQFSDVFISGVLNDSSQQPAVANWCTQFLNTVVLTNCANVGAWGVVTGNPIAALRTVGCLNVYQSTNAVVNESGTINIAANATQNQSGVVLQGIPILLSGNGNIFAPVPFSTVSASASGAGTIGAGTYGVTVSFLGWDNFESQPNPAVNVTVNGSQGILVSWTAQSGMQGAFVYFSGFRQNSSVLTGTSHTFTSFGNFGVAPALASTGLPVLTPSGSGEIITPTLVVPSGINKSTLTSGTLTGNRTVSMPDGNGTMLVGSAVGVGTGSPAGVTVNNQGAGQGPVNAIQIVGWTEINIAGQNYWIPLAV